ncbi:MAG TPA: aminoglycoside phosphotransferase family protein [Sphingomonas sp.]|nr:aminoglycoside phosphotransferase family protein [Sphingomonas sp.]
MTRQDDIVASLADIGIAAARIRAIEPLSGGVSSDVFRVDLDDRALCVKFAIERLRVARDWQAPVRRSAAEYGWLEKVGAWFPGWGPQVIGYDAARYGMAMAYLPPETHPNWKAELLSGHVDRAVAAQVGARLVAIHARSATEPSLAGVFANQDDFAALRIDPYLRFTAARHPELAQHIHALADALASASVALVHGDVSPKNILCGPAGPVFIDAECATWGDPAFDAAFVLNHLVIKALVLSRGTAASARALWEAYRHGVDWEPADTIETRIAALLPALMLARVDGKSPLEYLTGETAQLVRDRASVLLTRQPTTVGAILTNIEESR